jgi:hypothetical protein
LIQPERAVEPGSASSTASIAEKCERLGTERPTAWMAASSWLSQSDWRGAMLGCSPNIESAPMSDGFGTEVFGRAV